MPKKEGAETPLSLLEDARNTITSPDAWTQGVYQKVRAGKQCYCVVGAITKAAGDRSWVSARDRKAVGEAIRYLYRAIAPQAKADCANAADYDEKVFAFNDLFERRHSTILRKLDKAIELAKQDEAGVR